MTIGTAPMLTPSEGETIYDYAEMPRVDVPIPTPKPSPRSREYIPWSRAKELRPSVEALRESVRSPAVGLRDVLLEPALTSGAPETWHTRDARSPSLSAGSARCGLPFVGGHVGAAKAALEERVRRVAQNT